MSDSLVVYFLLMIYTGVSDGQPELFSNPGFEGTFSRNNWWCNFCTLSRNTDAYQGHYSGRVTNR